MHLLWVHRLTELAPDVASHKHGFRHCKCAGGQAQPSARLSVMVGYDFCGRQWGGRAYPGATAGMLGGGASSCPVGGLGAVSLQGSSGVGQVLLAP